MSQGRYGPLLGRFRPTSYCIIFPFFGDSEAPAAQETLLDFFSADDVNGRSSASESARRLVRGLLTVDPLKRVRSLRTVKNHAFYHHVDFESLRSKKHKRGRGQHGGKKHGAGNKGSGQRQNFMRLGYETGNNPFYLRVPKEPYYKGHHLRREYPPISLMQLQTLIDTGRLDTSKPIDLTALCNTKLFLLSPLENQYGFQLTDEGLDNFKGRINIEVQYAPEQVIAAIERNGGVITTAFYDAPSLLAMRDPMKFFASGTPIPKRQMPPENAVEYYTDPKNRGYLADPDLVALERFKLAQKYGYELPDLKKDAELLPMMLERKDPRQIFFGLNPGCYRHYDCYECDIDEGGDGSYLGQQFFRCAPGRGIFVPFRHCRADSRFSSSFDVTKPTSCGRIYGTSSELENGGPECPSVSGEVAPVGQFGDWSKLTGKFRGIQGHHNSCYLDATLFSMFTFTSIFDGLLYRPPTRNDIPQYEEVQRILKEEIVNPLRQHHYVRADKVMKLRRLLQKLGSVKGLTNEEKDPEEFLHCLLSQTLKAEPFLKLSSGQEAYHHQLFVEKDDKLVMPTVQQLFEQSFLSSGIKLKEVPPVLIIQMPRFGKSYKMYPYVLPSSLLDITDVLENSPRQCIVCGHLAEMECQQCLGQCGSGLESIAFCAPCLYKVHSHKKRTTHQAQPLQVPADFAALQEHCIIPRMYMELFAVVCIATSHYVAFVKCGPGPDAPWCFFDSMADRKGEQNGFNIPEVITCPDLPRWLSDEWDKQLLSNGSDLSSSSSSSNPTGAGLPDYVRRLFSDAYMCLYQSPDLMLYR
uniref:EOG090X03LH n=1 Tax=Daphnia lumholtzi TaxID=42856 RepID=A0A4Y7MEG9_9CRUS|nr:EOG090X03LH [Daphnia lumholtzi]